MANEIVVSTTLDLDSLKKGLKKNERASKTSGKRAGNKFGKAFERRSGALVGGLSKKFLALAGTIAAAFATRTVIAAASRQEDAINGLNAALKASGQFSKETSQDLQDFASEMQKVTTTGDETILELLKLGSAFGFSAEQSKVATKAALDLAVAADINVVEAMRRVGRTISGSTADVQKFAPEIANLTKEQLAAGDAATILANALAGQASAQTKTFSGRILQLNNAFGDLLEQIGFIITRSPVIASIIGKVSEAFVNLGDKIADFGKQGDVIKPFILNMLQLAGTINNFVTPIFELFFNAIKNGFNAIKFTALSFISFFNSDFKAQADEAFTALQESTAKMFDFDATAATARFIEQTQLFVESVKPVAEEAGRTIASGFVGPMQQATIESTEFITNAWNNAFSEIALTSEEFKKGLQTKLTGAFQAFRNGVSGAFSSIGQALAKGENGFAAFGKAILGIFGDLAIQLGQFYFLLGLGNLFINPAAAGQQIAAGIGLQILGGLLKGLAGGGGATASAGSVGGGVAAGGGGLEAPVQDVGQTFQEQEREVATAVTVNIAGNVLDRRETGLEIVEIINEAFGSDGVRIAEVGA